jgi:serine/threonine-protein kinase
MADVYLALSNGTAGFNKLIALKVVHQGVCEGPELIGMFRDEARLAARLHHENLIDTYETGDLGGRPFIAMEYLQGQTLSRVMRRLPNLQVELKLWVIMRALAGLHYAHELRGRNGEPLGIVHRDVSPSNLMLTYDGRVKLLDFGIAKAASAENLSRIGMFKGKMGYCAPEQLLGAEVDRRADIFSVGATLWELLVGRRLLLGNDAPALRRRVEGRENLRSCAAHVPEHLLAICERAMAREPENRFATSEEMALELEAHISLASFRDAPRSLSSTLSAEFREERAKLQVKIERQLAEAESAREAALKSATVPELGAELGAAAGLAARMRALWPERHTRARVVGSPERPWRQRGRLLPALSVIVMAGLVAVVRGRTQSTAPAERARPVESTPAPIQTPLSASLPVLTKEQASPSPSVPPVSPTVSLTIRAIPSSTRLYLDGAPLGSNPYVHTSPVDAALHTISARAPGFEPEERRVSLDVSRECEFRLQRVQPRWAGRAGTLPFQRRAPQRPTTPTTPRELDTRDPWE